MDINLEALRKLKEEKNWTLPQMAKKMDLDYSYLYRVFMGLRKPGGKFFNGLMLLCMDEGLDFTDYVQVNLGKAGKQRGDVKK